MTSLNSYWKKIQTIFQSLNVQLVKIQQKTGFVSDAHQLNARDMSNRIWLITTKKPNTLSH